MSIRRASLSHLSPVHRVFKDFSSLTCHPKAFSLKKIVKSPPYNEDMSVWLSMSQNMLNRGVFVKNDNSSIQWFSLSDFLNHLTAFTPRENGPTSADKTAQLK